jgi:hypothetical protein
MHKNTTISMNLRTKNIKIVYFKFKFPFKG